MARKSYPEEFRRRAVDLYESIPGAMLTGIAVDLGIGRGTLQSWVGEFGTGTVSASTLPAAAEAAARPESKTVRLARLEAENSKLMIERDILRAAAKYFAGETIW